MLWEPLAVAAPGLGKGGNLWSTALSGEGGACRRFGGSPALHSRPVRLPSARVRAAPPALCTPSRLSICGGEGSGAAPLPSPGLPGAPSGPRLVLTRTSTLTRSSQTWYPTE
eukprot:3586794-Rhodomonas_salina.1